MSIVSLAFLTLVFGTLLVYYLLPSKYQWCVLLASSLLFSVSTKWGILFILLTSITLYGATRCMDSISEKRKAYIAANKETLSKEDKKAYKEKCNKKRKRIMVLTLLFNFGILCAFKYSNFALDQVNNVLDIFSLRTISMTIPIPYVLGLSFYTFQSMGYLVDVYWENSKAQKNYFKTLLFVSFFPQITQGPISSYNQLSQELFSAHSFSYDNFSRGFQRLIWGFWKKMVIANLLDPIVTGVFDHYADLSGIICLFGAFAYSLQIYADFSGYMDIMTGVCELYGVHLSENFLRPYFSKSIAEYWRRWHITLGEWFKNYVYYPIGVSKWNRNLGKKLTQKFGKSIGKNVPAHLP